MAKIKIFGNIQLEVSRISIACKTLNLTKFVNDVIRQCFKIVEPKGGSRTVATSKVELIVIIVNGFETLTIITKSSTLDVAAVLGPPLEPFSNDFNESVRNV